jgi:hypothetical protein
MTHERLNCCHLCGYSTLEYALQPCCRCNQLVCPQCAVTRKIGDGRAEGLMCDECAALSEQKEPTDDHDA